MTLTLFGGMLLITALFFTFRLARVPNFWGGVISGTLPTLGMIAYSMKYWPGGDVMAIHIALYLATAIVLSLGFGRTPHGQSHKLHWGPVIITGFFVALSLLMAFFLSIATQGLPPELAKLLLPDADKHPVYTAFSGEVPHSEEAAKTISQYLKKAHQQKELGWELTVDGLDDLLPQETRKVQIAVVDAAKHPLNDASIQLALSRPGVNKAAYQWQLQPNATGQFQTNIRVAEGGQWLAVITVARAQDKFETAKEILLPQL